MPYLNLVLMSAFFSSDFVVSCLLTYFVMLYWVVGTGK